MIIMFKLIDFNNIEKILSLLISLNIVVLIRINMASVFEKAFRHIQNDELEEGLTIVSEHLLNDCIMLMSSISGVKNKYELYSLFHDNYLDFVNKVKEGKFSYVSDTAFKSFFKTGCSNKAKEYKRVFNKKEDWLSEDFFERNLEQFDNMFEANKKTEYGVIYEKYGINLDSEETDEEFPADVVKAFHLLNEKCKFLLVLKYMINLSHKEIVDCLCNFYELKNENVSKTELKRCLDNLKKQTEIN